MTELIGAAFIVIGDEDGIRLVHPVDDRIGKPMKGGDNNRALVDGESYISFAKGSLATLFAVKRLSLTPMAKSSVWFRLAIF